MSLITQCPACSTMFRVVPDQLRISEGWVRCGQCDEVFDANAHLRSFDETQSIRPVASVPVVPANPEPVQEEAPQLLAQAPQEAALPAQIAFEPEPEPEPESYDWGPVLSPPSASAQAGIMLDVGVPGTGAAQPYRPESDPFLEHSPQESRLEPAQEQLASAAAAPLDDWGLQHEQEVSALRHSEALEQQETGTVAPVAEELAPSFMATGATPSWVARRGPGRKLMAGLCVLLLLLLGLQWLLSDRDRIAATAPALRPLLASTCSVLGCTISPLRQIEAIAIDSSSFTSVKPGVYLLKLTLKNAAAVDLATPALELTLTDTQDQPLLRRIVLPAEFNGKRSIAAGAELASSLPVSVAPGAVPEKISGYKLLAFYP